MSKSLGNSLLDRRRCCSSVRAVELRYYLGGAALPVDRSSTPTRRCDEAVAAYRRIECVRAPGARAGRRRPSPAPLCPTFAAAMDDDLGTPRRAGRRARHRARGQHRARRGRPRRRAASHASSVRAMTAVLGLDPFDPHWATRRDGRGDRGRGRHAGRRPAGAAAGGPRPPRLRRRGRRARTGSPPPGIVVEDSPDGPTWSLQGSHEDSMAGNSQRRGAMRKDGTKKGMVVGSGGQRRRGAGGPGPTPPAEMRKGHPAQRLPRRRPSTPRRRRPTVARPRRRRRRRRRTGDRARPQPGGRVPARRRPRHCRSRHAGQHVRRAGRRGRAPGRRARASPILEVPRGDLDRIAGGALHQGVALHGAALRVRPSRRAARDRRGGAHAGPDRRARRRHRPPQPRRGRPLGRARSAGTAWWSRSGVPRA